ncbi:hypothetical protein [Fulvimarina sp. MAC3]|uniref:hypothetical protein n=1 Tax=Fulvimarina sp. MAC3 TaxID=3148887 RepID=UPI0031FBD54C
MDNGFSNEAGRWLAEAWADIEAMTATALDWFSGPAPVLFDQALATLQERAANHPVVAAFAVAAIVATLLVTRNVLALIAAGFFSIAALVGTEPVTDPLARLAFPIGCLTGLGFLLTVIARHRRRSRRLGREIKETEAKLSSLQERYDSEVRWRMAERRPAPPAEEKSSEGSASPVPRASAQTANAPHGAPLQTKAP